ncbi:MAG: DUF1622 domain-containing protein [Oscillospiraceae bacterium]|nr:DUF1622 domain-containing protein [Oscillospiraceae bacterium]
MGGALETAENLMHAVIEWGIILLELFGVCILVYTSVTCFVKWIRKEQNIRLELAQGTTLALSFKMGGEVLRTVVVREWRELGILGAVIVLRTALTLLLHWEIENEKKDLEGLEIVTDESILNQKKTRKPEEKAGNA